MKKFNISAVSKIPIEVLIYANDEEEAKDKYLSGDYEEIDGQTFWTDAEHKVLEVEEVKEQESQDAQELNKHFEVTE
jgi:hypothetical protein